MKSDFIRDKNNKLSHKRLIALISLAIALVLLYLQAFTDKNVDSDLIKWFFGITVLESGLSLFETK